MSPERLATAAGRITTLASDRAVHRAFHWLHLHEPRLRNWQKEFLAIPAPPFGEGQRAIWFLDQFKALGLQNPHLDAEGNALAELSATTDATTDAAPAVLLSAHLDTVFPPGTDCTPREDGPRLLCPGASDNGAGLTALLALAAGLTHAKLQPACTILFAANVGEEGEGDLRGMRHLFSAASPYFQRIRTVIALEGSGTGTVVDRALGSRRLRVTVTGPGGHSWADAGRPNPVLALATALIAVARLPLPAKPRTTVNIGTIQGGTSVNSIPAFATADLDLRSTSALELDRTELAVLQTFSDAIESYLPGPRPATTKSPPDSSPRDGALRFHVARIGDRPVATLHSTSALFTSLRAVDRHLAIATEPRIGSTDANLPLSLGIPAVAIGAGGVGTGIHTLDEAYDPTGRDLALRRALLLLLDACTLATE